MGILDKFFESANSVLDAVDNTLPPVEGPAPEEQKDENHKAWEDSWKDREVGWAMCRKLADNGAEIMDGYHAFHPKQEDPTVRKAVCTTSFKPERVGEVKVLDHNRRLTICTSCVIGVTK